MNTAELVDKAYMVCGGCKEGKLVEPGDEHTPQSTLDWMDHHFTHNGTEGLTTVPARIFLSTFLTAGYIDVDREGLEPLPITGNAPTGDKPAPFGLPGDTAAARKLHRDMARDLPPRPPFQTAVVQVAQTDERPASVPAMPRRRDFTLRDLQAQLPWSVKYSQDFRLNPQSHKDFAHAITHVMKAAGQLAGIVDDHDHRRESEDDARIGKLLADLVVCALRAANTTPGQVIDLQHEVVSRIESKNEVVLKDPFRNG